MNKNLDTNTKDKYLKFSEALKQFRDNKKLSQAEMAEKLNVSELSYGGYERGVHSPKADFFYTFAKVFGKHSLTALFSDGDDFSEVIYFKAEQLIRTHFEENCKALVKELCDIIVESSKKQ